MIALDHQKIAAFCYHRRTLTLCGSMPRDDFGLESNGDLCVLFELGAWLGGNIVIMEARP
jgi:hypothetical protein